MADEGGGTGGDLADIWVAVRAGYALMERDLAEAQRMAASRGAEIGNSIGGGVSKGVGAALGAVFSKTLGLVGTAGSVILAPFKLLTNSILGIFGGIGRGIISIFGFVGSTVATLLKGMFLPLGVILAGGGVGMAGAFALKGMIQSAADFQDAIRKATAEMRGARDNFDGLVDAARKASRETGRSTEDIAEAYRAMARNGMDAKTSVGALNTVLQYSGITGQSSAEAVEQLIVSLKKLGYETATPEALARNMEYFGNVLAAAARAGGTTAETLRGLMGSEAAEAAGRYGVDIRDMAAAMAALQASGKGEEARGLPHMLNMIERLASRAKGGLSELRGELTTAEGNLKGPIDLFEALGRQIQGLGRTEAIEKLQKLGFQRGLAANVMEYVEAVGKMRETRGAMGDVRGAMDQTSEAMSGTFAGAVAKVRAVVKDIGNVIGRELLAGSQTGLKALWKVLDDIRAGIENFLKLPQIRESLRAISENITTTLGNLMGKAKSALGGTSLGEWLAKGIEKLLNIGAKVTEVIAVFTSNFERAWPIIKSGAIAAFSEVMVWLWDNLIIPLKAGFATVWDILQTPEAKAAIRTVLDTLSVGFKAVIDFLVNGLKAAISWLAEQLLFIGSKIWDILSGKTTDVKTLLQERATFVAQMEKEVSPRREGETEYAYQQRRFEATVEKNKAYVARRMQEEEGKYMAQFAEHTPANQEFWRKNFWQNVAPDLRRQLAEEFNKDIASATPLAVPVMKAMPTVAGIQQTLEEELEAARAEMGEGGAGDMVAGFRRRAVEEGKRAGEAYAQARADAEEVAMMEEAAAAQEQAMAEWDRREAQAGGPIKKKGGAEGAGTPPSVAGAAGSMGFVEYWKALQGGLMKDKTQDQIKVNTGNTYAEIKEVRLLFQKYFPEKFKPLPINTAT